MSSNTFTVIGKVYAVWKDQTRESYRMATSGCSCLYLFDEKLVLGPAPRLVQITNAVGLAVFISMWVVAVVFGLLAGNGIHVENGNWWLLVLFGSWLLASMMWLVLKVLIGLGMVGHDEAGVAKLISDKSAAVIDVSDIVRTESYDTGRNKKNHTGLVVHFAKDVLRLEMKRKQYNRLSARVPSFTVRQKVEFASEIKNATGKRLAVPTQGDGQ